MIRQHGDKKAHTAGTDRLLLYHDLYHDGTNDSSIEENILRFTQADKFVATRRMHGYHYVALTNIAQIGRIHLICPRLKCTPACPNYLDNPSVNVIQFTGYL